MKSIHSLIELRSAIKENEIALLYISRQSCSVCHSLLPQVEELLEKYPFIVFFHVDADEIPEIAGEYAIFTVPAILVFADGREMIRKARFVPIRELDGQLSKLAAAMGAVRPLIGRPK